MEIKQLSKEISKRKIIEEIRTVEFLQQAMNRHNYIFDISNHYIFTNAATAIAEFLSNHY